MAIRNHNVKLETGGIPGDTFTIWALRSDWWWSSGGAGSGGNIILSEGVPYSVMKTGKRVSFDDINFDKIQVKLDRFSCPNNVGDTYTIPPRPTPPPSNGG